MHLIWKTVFFCRIFATETAQAIHSRHHSPSSQTCCSHRRDTTDGDSIACLGDVEEEDENRREKDFPRDSYQAGALPRLPAVPLRPATAQVEPASIEAEPEELVASTTKLDSVAERTEAAENAEASTEEQTGMEFLGEVTLDAKLTVARSIEPSNLLLFQEP